MAEDEGAPIAPVSITVRDIVGNATVLENVHASATTAKQLKEMVCAKSGGEYELLRLTFESTAMDDEMMTLADYGIEAEVTLRLSPQSETDAKARRVNSIKKRLTNGATDHLAQIKWSPARRRSR
jgi:hypothetical protein